MLPNDVATVRVTNIAPGLQKSDLNHFFESHEVNLPQASLVASKSGQDALLVATATFGSPSEAKKALELNGKGFGLRHVCIDREFMGLTVLAAPRDPSVE